MDLGLQGKVALISGASAGIGRATAKVLAQEGVQTVIVARREQQLRELADEIAAAGGTRPMVIVDDLTDREAPHRVGEKVLGQFGYLDILINNLGQARPFELETPDSDWDAAFELNFMPPRKLAAEFIPKMRERKFGRIVNLVGALEPVGVSGSLPAKAAVVLWAKGLSRIVAKYGITVNCITPVIMTDQVRNHYIPLMMPTKEDQERWLAREIPAGRFGEPEDAAHIITFLCSPLASFITGQRLGVDGGWQRYI